MKKSEAKAVTSLVILGIIIYPFVWIYEQIGLFGVLILIAIVIGGIVAFSSASKKQEEKEFNDLPLCQDSCHP